MPSLRPGAPTVAVLCLVWFLPGGSLLAQVLLQPHGRNAVAMRTKRLNARVRIDRSFATTDLDLVFQNEMSDRIEADFIYTTPPHSVVTGFAYYYGSERVVARVAEKERAAEVYRSITSRMRDPALIEKVGENRFRARIFPVMPNADLRVEIQMVQALPVEDGAVAYDLPLSADRDPRSALDSVDVSVSVRNDLGLLRVVNSLGLPVTRQGGRDRIDLVATNYRPPHALRIGLIPKPVELRADLYSARSGGPDGFFALALTPAHLLSNPSVRIRGVETFQVVTSDLSSGARRGGHTLLVCGRYRRSGPGTVVVTGRTPRGTVAFARPLTFNGAAEPNHVGAKLWAAARIAQLEADPRHRPAVVALSHRHGIPSKWTSWIAIPTEERERYRREKAAVELDRAVHELALRLGEGAIGSARLNRLRNRVADLARAAQANPLDALRDAFDRRIGTLARQVVTARRSGDRRVRSRLPRLQEELARLARESGVRVASYLEREERRSDDAEARGAAIRLAHAIVVNRTAEIARLRSHLDALAIRTGRDAMEPYFRDSLQTLAQTLVNEREKSRPNRQVVTSLDQKMERLERESGIASGPIVRAEEVRFAHAAAEKAGDGLYKAIMDGREATPQAQEMRDAIDRWSRMAAGGDATAESYARDVTARADQRALDGLMNRYANEVVEGRGSGEAAQSALQRYCLLDRREGRAPEPDLRQHLTGDGVYQDRARQLAVEQDRPALDEARIANLEMELGRLERAAGVSGADYRERARKQYEETSDNDRPEWNERRVLLDEERKDAPDPTRVEQLAAHLQVLTEARRGPGYARARIDRLAAEVAIGKLAKLHLRAEEMDQRQAALEARRDELRARMGDPLLSVEAPADTVEAVALMPDGGVKPLAFDAASRAWQARFDIPAYAQEGLYVVTVILIRKDGARRSMTIRYHVDVTPPTGSGVASRISGRGGDRLRLEVDGEEDTARVTAFIPGEDPVAMSPTPGRPGHFFALVPIAGNRTVPRIRYVLTDRAHNRTTLTVDVSQ